jgi:hypothetical protein
MVDLGKGENKTKEFVDLNPNKTVPVLNDNGFVLYERSATPLNLVNLLFHFSLFTIAISDFAVKMLMSRYVHIVPLQCRDLVLLGSTIQGTTPHPSHKSFRITLTLNVRR